ncbi:WhiB family transcriptional regulator [Streptomyces shenzhenensis]|uniref:4Fe-4S Wbl-type domain-containing protein n=1 Tax=Streptomyces shenzhenensis TaxID=943815 RepID=A0A3M0I9Q9_9ACTN|nr:WhiB family transcriptional regulator [Streptomyces shenzhenensis]RMB85605.1 hypothetical protein CTZ28_12495 [Streptomyces shenzhenensis]
MTSTLHDLMIRTPGLPCRLDHEPFFSDQARERAAAVRQCQTCPLRTPCAAYAIETRQAHGVWGGTTAADRRSFRDGRPWRFDEHGQLRLVCGSEAAYRAHFGYREQPCDECTAAHDAHVEAERRARLAVEHEAGGSSRGYHLHRVLGEPACDECKGAQAKRSAADRARGRKSPQRARGGRGVRKSTDTAPGAPADAQTFQRAA